MLGAVGRSFLTKDEMLTYPSCPVQRKQRTSCDNNVHYIIYPGWLNELIFSSPPQLCTDGDNHGAVGRCSLTSAATHKMQTLSRPPQHKQRTSCDKRVLHIFIQAGYMHLPSLLSFQAHDCEPMQTRRELSFRRRSGSETKTTEETLAKRSFAKGSAECS